MLCGMFIFSAVDTQAKFLTGTMHPVQIIWFRQLGLLSGVIILLGIHGTSLLHTSRARLQIGRGALAIGSALLFVFAIQHVPLADAVAATFVAPFFLTIMGAAVLGEKIGIYRWSAVVVGFIGALIIIRPGLGVIHPAVMLVVIAAAIYSARQVIGRLLADTDKTVTTIAYTAITGSVLISIPLPFVWQWPESSDQLLILSSMAVMAGIGEVLVIKALEVTEAVVIAPIHYTLIIWGTLYGYLIFNELPDRWTITGTIIIISAGLFTVWRGEKKRGT
ncbi:transporter [Chromatiales bacterium (ex Bugula neritina AB1)]|nr:transporter [Chromatiales bacterium (ex Bugula neritina AB1)]